MSASPVAPIPMRLASEGDRALAFGPRQAVATLILSLALYGFIALGAFLLSRLDASDAACLGLVHVGSAVALVTCWRRGRWGRAGLDCFGAILLLFAAGFRLHALVDTWAFGARIDEIYMYPNVPVPPDAISLFLEAETVALVGLLLVACAWRVAVGARVERYSFLLHLDAVPSKVPFITYVGALGVDLAGRVLGVDFGALTQLSSTLFLLGVASIYMTASRMARRPRRVLVAIAMGLPMTVLALNKGMKSEMFFPMVPAAVLFWMAYRNALLRTLFVLAAFAVLAVSQVYVFYVRSIAWHADSIERLSPVTLVSGFMGQLPYINLADALDSTSSRINLTTTHAITVALADNKGFEPGNVFGPIPATFIPRLLWPGKPVLQPGAMHTARILGIDTPLGEIRSATAAGFSTELYLGGWWIGVVVGGLAYGALLASAQAWAYRATPGFGHAAFCFLAAYWALRFDENHVVYAYTGIALFVAVLWILLKVTTTFGVKSQRSAASNVLQGRKR